MDTPFSLAAPARLYALLLKLRPLQPGTLMPFSGELVHGAWLDWLRTAAPDVATWLHDGNKRRLFTCSSLQFPLPMHRMLEAERDNIHLPLVTTFNRGNSKGRAYGNYPARLPLPQYIFPGLVKRWQELAPPELAHVVQMERVEQYIQDDGIIVADYELKAHQVRFTTHPQLGFVGTCKYHLRGPDEATTSEALLTVRQQMLLLAQLAFYCGVGHKTAMGLGRVRTV